jgi:hypothetical protein
MSAGSSASSASTVSFNVSTVHATEGLYQMWYRRLNGQHSTPVLTDIFRVCLTVNR